MDDQQSLFFEKAPAPVGPLKNILVGTCSWTDPSLIKSKRFYPRGTNTAEGRLRFYASQFSVVEVDSSYFAMPTEMNSIAWAERTPPHFKFSVKAFRLFTGHQTPPESLPGDLRPLLPKPKGKSKNLYYADIPGEIQDEMWCRFIAALAPLKAADKLIAVHFQFAPWVTDAPEWVALIAECVSRMTGHHLAVEFRNQRWLNEQRAARTMEWLRGLAVTHVVVDEPQGVGNFAHTVWDVTSPQLAIVRLHGRNAETWDAKGLSASSERFNYEYPDEELHDLAVNIVSLAAKAFLVVVLLNVNQEDQGTRAARKLLGILAGVPMEHLGSAGRIY